MEKFFIFIVIMITGTKELCEGCIESERNGLLQIKSSFNPNSDPEILSSWGTSDPDCCNWEKLHCDYKTGHVIFLDLSLMTDFDSEDSWYLNASLFLPFPRLSALHLGYNNIAGCIHNEGFERLSSTLTNLEFLLLMSNKFNNTILQSLSGFYSLKYLFLSDNKLNGTINIAELNNLTSTLHKLELDDNEIEGFESIQVFSKLESLSLSGNRFNSRIFPFLRDLSSLNYLFLGFNNFKGPFNITEIDGLSNLQGLELSGNEITEFIVSKDSRGTISNLSSLYLDNMTTTTGISNLLQHLPTLKTLSLMYNDFRGLQVFGKESFKKLEELDLSYSQFNQTTDEVLRSIERMSSLKRLLMRECGLSGIIASQELCDSKNLQHLRRNFNDSNEDLPWCLSNLTSLQYLNISHNLFKIPISLAPFFNLSKLTKLFIDNNSIYADTEDHNSNPKFQLEYLSMDGYGEGEAFPKFLYHQHNLEYVIISNLKLRGEFPYWLLQNNTGLGHLDLSNNFLSGNLQLPYKPHESTIRLDISNNFINGSIPSHIGDFFPGLSSLLMSKNELKGSIPSSLCKCFACSLLDISQNNISGTIPKCIENMSYLEILDLSYNNVSGNLPSNFNSSNLIIINLSNNKLQGSLKDAFYYCISLFQLDLSHNNFSGSIPSSIGILSQLSFIMLGHNNLQGEIPNELCTLKQLSFIDLSHNNIVGHIPRCLNITSYWSRRQTTIDEIKDMEITMKGRPYKYSETILSYISGIDISRNYLTGEIPSEIGDLISMKLLNVSRNRLRGTIPPTFSSLKDIESLDLSHNNLQGEIPPQLTQLTSLAVFDVSYNNLSGQIPNNVAQFGTFNEMSYVGNPFLCGWPLSKSCSLTDGPSPNASTALINDNSSNRFIDIEDFFASFGVAYAMVLFTLAAVLCINTYWRRVWFYYVQMSIDMSYYLIIDNVIPLFTRY